MYDESWGDLRGGVGEAIKPAGRGWELLGMDAATNTQGFGVGAIIEA